MKVRIVSNTSFQYLAKPCHRSPQAGEPLDHSSCFPSAAPCLPTAMSSTTRQQMFEGVGAPVEVERNGGHVDPTLDSCCQREVRSFGALVMLMSLWVHGLCSFLS